MQADPLLLVREYSSRAGHPPPGLGQSASYTVSPFIGTNLLKATTAFITCQTTQVQRSNLALFVFALLLDYCVFVALLNMFAIQHLHLALEIPHFFSPRICDETSVESYLASVTVLAIFKISHIH